MTLRSKTILIVLLGQFALGLALYAVFTTVLMEGFQSIEDNIVQKNIARTERTISDLFEVVANKTSDWALWDDTYRFIKDHNKEFVKSNLIIESLAALKIEYMLFVDKKGRIVERRGINPETSEAKDVPESVSKTFSENSPFLQHVEGQSEGHRGLLILPEGPLIFAALPILTSAGQGPSRGTVVFAISLDETARERIAHIANADVSISRFDHPGATAEFGALRQELLEKQTAIKAVDASHIEGYGLFKDYFGKPALILKVTGPRPVYEQGQVTLRTLLIAAGSSGLVFCIIVMFLLSKSVLQRLARLSRTVRRIAVEGHIAERVPEEGKDEITDLAFGMNTMLVALAASERDLREARDAAQAASKAKSMFVANMSHEVRTPLNGVIGMTQILLNMHLPREVRDYIGLAKSSAESLLSVVNDILDFSKIEAGKLELEHIEFPLQQTLRETLSTVVLRAHSKGLELCCLVDPQVPQKIVGDPVRLRQVIINLIGNAIKFTEKGEIAVSVSLKESRPHDVTLHFEVRDTGIGIAREKLGTIFEAFSQAEGSTTRKYGGTGLGLTISRQLVGLMGGEVAVDSDLGAGTVFSFNCNFGLPQAKTEAVPVEVFQKLAGTSVYVACPNSTTRSDLIHTLQSWHLNPHGCATAVDLFTALCTAPADPKRSLLLIDSEISGEEVKTVLSKLAAHTRWRDIPVVIMLAFHRIAERSSLIEHGAKLLVMKPLLPDQLLLTLRTVLLGEKQLQDESEETSDCNFKPRRKLQILVVDDTQVNRTVAKLMLEQWGHQVQLAENGKQAVEFLEKRAYLKPGQTAPPPCDIVLMDVQMPVMDGLEATSLIRDLEHQQKKRKGLPIVALTAHVLPEERANFMRVGFDRYLTKPLSAQALFKTLEELGAAPAATSVQETIAIAVPEGAGSSEKDLLGKAEELLSALPAAAELQGISKECGRFDLKNLLEQFGNEESLVLQILDAVRDECPKFLSQLEEAWRENSPTAVNKAAHAIKGALRNAGASYAASIAEKIELLARRGGLDEAKGYDTPLKTEVRTVCDILDSLIQTAKTKVPRKPCEAEN